MTASYKLFVKKEAEKELRRVPKADLTRMTKRISALSTNPRPYGCEKLSTLERYRIRQGVWRVLYEIDDEAKTVTVVKIGHRREVYR